MKKVKGQPITGTNIEMSKKRPFVPDAKDTSADAQTMIAEAPSPFKNRNQTGEMPAGTGARGSVPGLEPRIKAGMQHTNPGVKALPSGGPVGQNRLPSQSQQIGGRMGFPPPRRKAGDNSSGYKVKKNAAFFGE